MKFTKYQGARNDFVMILRSEWNQFDESLTPILCDRRRGIGADGVIVIEPSDEYDFEVNYLNADGSKSFCGNGARCAVAFAAEKKCFSGNTTRFLAIDGVHEGTIVEAEIISVSMGAVDEVQKLNEQSYFCDTGSPHYVSFVTDLEVIDVAEDGRAVRYSAPYKDDGVNVNWIEKKGDSEYNILTYERGVEGETYACGTGATAAALIVNYVENTPSPIKVQAKGGLLKIYFDHENGQYRNIYLEGPAKKVFEGEWD